MKKFFKWLVGLTLLLRCFVIAMLVHVAILFVIGSIKIVQAMPQIAGLFTAVEETKPLINKEPDPMAAYRDVDYDPPGVKGQRSTTECRLSIDQTSTPTDSTITDVIGVTDPNTIGQNIRLASPATGLLGLPATGGIGEGKIGYTTGTGPWRGRLSAQRTINASLYGSSSQTELAVMAALRWLKANQNSNGSWGEGSHQQALSALATMAFLGHGETPESKEFGDVVSRGIQYLLQTIDSNGIVTPAHGHYMYTQGVITLALSEAYGMTGAKVVRDPLERSVKAILASQKANQRGAWRYSITSTDADTSVVAWLVMGLKSAKLAGIEVPEESFELASKYLWSVCHDDGGFGYNNNSRTANMTGAGVLCQQFLGHGKDPRIKKSIEFLKQQKMNWNEAQGNWPLYGWYYATQAMFQAGRTPWEYWNKQMRDTLVKEQSQDGHWDPPAKSNEKSYGPVYSTALCCLMLEVYYRYMPLHKEMERHSSVASK